MTSLEIVREMMGCGGGDGVFEKISWAALPDRLQSGRDEGGQEGN